MFDFHFGHAATPGAIGNPDASATGARTKPRSFSRDRGYLLVLKQVTSILHAISHAPQIGPVLRVCTRKRPLNADPSRRIWGSAWFRRSRFGGRFPCQSAPASNPPIRPRWSTVNRVAGLFFVSEQQARRRPAIEGSSFDLKQPAPRIRTWYEGGVPPDCLWLRRFGGIPPAADAEETVMTSLNPLRPSSLDDLVGPVNSWPACGGYGAASLYEPYQWEMPWMHTPSPMQPPEPEPPPPPEQFPTYEESTAWSRLFDRLYREGNGPPL